MFIISLIILFYSTAGLGVWFICGGEKFSIVSDKCNLSAWMLSATIIGLGWYLWLSKLIEYLRG